jgi:predicted nucleic acid-binding protein
MKESRVFLDTSILVYAHDISAGARHDIAKDKVVELWESGLGVLSTQVLQEFYVVVTSKTAKPMSPDEARDIIAVLLKWEVIVNDGYSILRAIDLQQRYGYSFWDCMIIGAAIEGRADILLSGDLDHGETISGLKIIDPFAG